MVRRKKNNGPFYYEFNYKGKCYRGTCHGCVTKKAAEEYEANLKHELITVSKFDTLSKLVEYKKQELTGGYSILLTDAYERSLLKPRSRVPNNKTVNQKRAEFTDFVAFMNSKYPGIKELADVTLAHAEEYISIIRTRGRFQDKVSYNRDGKEITRKSTEKLSARTANHYQTTCAEVFQLLGNDAGITENPFKIPKLPKKERSREAFSPEELDLIYRNLDDFNRPLFTIALFTALREGDICTLRWQEVDLKNDLIRRRMNKTGNEIVIPILYNLKEFLLTQYAKSGKGEYVFPALEKMYRSNPTGISYRIKDFLERLGIKTTEVPHGRSHAVSIKDLHSCRHTFCYLMGMANVPLVVVQSIVGHMSPEMTKYYSAHATLEDKKHYMLPMNNLFIQASKAESRNDVGFQKDEAARQRLKGLVDTIPIEEVYILLDKYSR